MPTYEYLCEKCRTIYEVFHEMSCEDEFECSDCKEILVKQISSTFHITTGTKPTLEDAREESHRKKVKDHERAIRKRRKAFGSSEVGSPSDKADPKHLVRGKVLGGQEKEIDRKEFIKNAAKSDLMVDVAAKALKKAKK